MWAIRIPDSLPSILSWPVLLHLFFCHPFTCLRSTFKMKVNYAGYQTDLVHYEFYQYTVHKFTSIKSRGIILVWDKQNHLVKIQSLSIWEMDLSPNYFWNSLSIVFTQGHSTISSNLVQFQWEHWCVHKSLWCSISILFLLFSNHYKI